MTAIGFVLVVLAFVLMLLVPVSKFAPRWQIWTVCLPILAMYGVGFVLIVAGIARWLWEVAP